MAAEALCLGPGLADPARADQPRAPVPRARPGPLPDRRHRPAGKSFARARARHRRGADRGARNAGADPQDVRRLLRHRARALLAAVLPVALRIAAAALLCALPLVAAAQNYPTKPIRLMIGYTAGGSAEAGARPLGRALEPILGQPLVFEYRPGNAGGVAMEAIARAPNDGYTIYYFDSGPLTVAPHLNKVGYHNLNSFTHLGHVCGSGSLLVV